MTSPACSTGAHRRTSTTASWFVAVVVVVVVVLVLVKGETVKNFN